jgi:hypothetical protein
VYVYVIWALAHSPDPIAAIVGVSCHVFVWCLSICGSVNSVPCSVCTDDRIGNLIADSVALEWVLSTAVASRWKIR